LDGIEFPKLDTARPDGVFGLAVVCVVPSCTVRHFNVCLWLRCVAKRRYRSPRSTARSHSPKSWSSLRVSQLTGPVSHQTPVSPSVQHSLQRRHRTPSPHGLSPLPLSEFQSTFSSGSVASRQRTFGGRSLSSTGFPEAAVTDPIVADLLFSQATPVKDELERLADKAAAWRDKQDDFRHLAAHRRAAVADVWCVTLSQSA
jgi:hypothetical protein